MKPPPSFRRWLNVVLRGVHLITVIALGASLLGAPVDGGLASTGVAASGLAMLMIDTWGNPDHLSETAGVAVLVKLALVAWMAADAAWRLPLFWLVVAGSAVFAHAPASFRHARLF